MGGKDAPVHIGGLFEYFEPVIAVLWFALMLSYLRCHKLAVLKFREVLFTPSRQMKGPYAKRDNDRSLTDPSGFIGQTERFDSEGNF
jgi:hypothetical protein